MSLKSYWVLIPDGKPLTTREHTEIVKVKDLREFVGLTGWRDTKRLLLEELGEQESK